MVKWSPRGGDSFVALIQQGCRHGGTSLNLPPNLLKHKTLMIALLLIARHLAKALRVDGNAPLTGICAQLQANRTSVYEQADRILGCLRDLAGARPGRPAGDTPDPPADLNAGSITIQVLDFRLEHPGSLVQQRGRAYYAPAFQRFVLSLLDQWQGTLEGFADAARVPIDTLRDWIQRDQQGVLPQQNINEHLPTPRNASQVVRDIAREWQRWYGTTRHFFGHAAQKFCLSTAQVERVLRVLKLISRRPRKPFRFRGETHSLAPGTMLVTDGKQVNVHLLASDQLVHFNWQAIVDQTTACHTAVVVDHHECAAGVADAFRSSVYTTLGGILPDALLHDNKPIYQEASLRHLVQKTFTSNMIRATPWRPENKAVIEGIFGQWEQRVGTIQLDDSSPQALIHSATQEIIRAYTAATDSVPRIELDGKSRRRTLNEYCPSAEQTERDRAFLERLKADHNNARPRQPDPSVLDLLDTVFQRLRILDKDPNRSLRSFLASFQTAAIRRAAALVATKLERGLLDTQYVHRYLAKLVISFQEQIDLERAADELLVLCRAQNESWTKNEELDLQLLADSLDHPDLACAIAENAAFGGIPLKAAFWKSKLLDLLKNASHLILDVRKHLIRLYEAPADSRIALLDLITALELGLA